MKNLSDKLFEGRGESNFTRIPEGSMSGKVLCDCYEMNHSKKMGALGWDANDECTYLMEFNSVEDLADAYGTEPEDWLGIEKAKVGEWLDDGAGHCYVRIW